MRAVRGFITNWIDKKMKPISRASLGVSLLFRLHSALNNVAVCIETSCTFYPKQVISSNELTTALPCYIVCLYMHVRL